uniref:Somatostatin receptor type 3-like n=1 Tax=Saccoglossus kowalevskii TaxID=10224 RepID=A0ABM0H1L0_SACKO|nr:PREDICTED: somatostatin receptor type 3-like [Saccoglossus kowalevskii]
MSLFWDRFQAVGNKTDFALTIANATNYNSATMPLFSNPVPSWFFVTLIPILSTLFCVLGLIGNGMVLFVLIRLLPKQSVPNIYIMNLASADFLFLLGVPLLNHFNTTRQWNFGSTVCKLVMGIDGMNMFTGIYTLTIMAVDRFVAVVYAVPSRNYRTASVARITCVVLWILSAITALPLWMYAHVENNNNNTVCVVVGPKTIEFAFSVYSNLFGFCLPLLVILVCYVKILQYLYQRRTQKGRRSRLGRVNALILVAVILFVVCWAPFWGIQLLLMVSPNISLSTAVQVTYYCTPLLSYINSCCNPIIYTFFKHDFREMLHVICSVKYSKESSSTYKAVDVNESKGTPLNSLTSIRES